MRMINIKKFYTFCLIILLNLPLFSQIKIRELPQEQLTRIDSTIYQLSETRPVISLNRDWKAFVEGQTEKHGEMNVPATFSGAENLIFEKSFRFDKSGYADLKKELFFLGVSYSCEVFLNDVSIHKHPGGETPFSIELNEELLNENQPNILRVIVNSEYDAINTIPLKQRFLFPDVDGGIVGDVFIRVSPDYYLTETNREITLNENFSKGTVKFNLTVTEQISGEESLTDLTVGVNLLNMAGESAGSVTVKTGALNNGRAELNPEITLNNPELWSLSNPSLYIYTITLSKNDSIIDKYSGRTGFCKIEKNDSRLYVNGKEFSFYGTGYVPYDSELKNMIGKDKIREELKQIKQAGFNAVRFSKVIPNPYVTEYCADLGLFAFVDLPLNSMPVDFTTDANFTDRAAGRIKSIIETYNGFTAVAAFGTGSSYIADSPEHYAFINKLAGIVKENSDKLVYASFIGFPNDIPTGIDFAGIESYAKPIEQLTSGTDRVASKNGKNNYLFSEVNYPVFNGGTDGYLNDFSLEAQAKYYSDVIDYVQTNKTPGFFFASYYDYQGHFNSFFAGYNKDKVYKIGILGEDKGLNRLTYKVIRAKLNNGEKVNIPLGSKKDDAPILFILTGLFLAIVVALLVNSKRKFREDVMRALFRPYNFFADVRDHRILSGFHSNILFLTLAGAHSLLITNLLYFFRHDIMFDRVLLSFGSEWLIDLIAWLAWNPFEALIYLFILSVLFVLFISFFFLLTTFFIRTKVMFSSIYYSAIWAFLPLSLLLPLELVLYRILTTGVVNPYIFIILLVFFLWLAQRLLKGIYVIFDVRAVSVYFTTFVFFLLVAGGMYLYFHLTEETTFYLINAWKQYKVM